MKNLTLLALSTAIAGMLMAEPGMSAETNPPAGSIDASVPMMGSLTGNVGATSNYMWRGGNDIDWHELNANFNMGAITFGLGYTSYMAMQIRQAPIYRLVMA